MTVPGYVSDISPGEGFHVFIPFPDTYLLDKRHITEVEVGIDDGRTISKKQRNKIFAMVADITDYISAPVKTAQKRAQAEMLRQLSVLYLIDRSDREDVRRQLTHHFCELCDIELFSLSDVDMTTAREFIDWLVELCVVHGIPCNDTLLNRAEDIGRYLYACVANRRCCICGQSADIHEVDAVGMGRDRRKMHHLGQRVQPLCRKHHRERHTCGQKVFDEKYHLESIRLDEYLCRVIGWKI